MQVVNLIGRLSTGGGPAPVLESISITENGIYTPGEGVDGYNNISVDVEPDLETKTVTANGTYTPSAGKDGFSEFTVNAPSPTYGQLSATSNGTYAPSTYNKDAFDLVVVNVPSMASIKVNGEYLVIQSVLETISCNFITGKYYGFIIYDDYIYPRYDNKLATGLFKRLTGTQQYYFDSPIGSISTAIITDNTFTLSQKIDNDTVSAKITIFQLSDELVNTVMPV